MSITSGGGGKAVGDAVGQTRGVFGAGTTDEALRVMGPLCPVRGEDIRALERPGKPPGGVLHLRGSTSRSSIGTPRASTSGSSPRLTRPSLTYRCQSRK